MPRNMSFALTTTQVKNQTKSVTRRQGWNQLQVGDQIQPVEKCMGLKKGEKVVKLGGLIQITGKSREPISNITAEDLPKEGFPDSTVDEFVTMYCQANRCSANDLCNRIEFVYL